MSTADHQGTEPGREERGEADCGLQWPVFQPITESDIQTMQLQWLTEERGVTGQPRGVCVVWQGPEKATVLKG